MKVLRPRRKQQSQNQQSRERLAHQKSPFIADQLNWLMRSLAQDGSLDDNSDCTQIPAKAKPLPQLTYPLALAILPAGEGAIPRRDSGFEWNTDVTPFAELRLHAANGFAHRLLY